MKENDVEIEICLIDYVLDNDKLDIDIYLLEEVFVIVDVIDNCFFIVNGVDVKDIFLDLEINYGKDEKGGN